MVEEGVPDWAICPMLGIPEEWFPHYEQQKGETPISGFAMYLLAGPLVAKTECSRRLLETLLIRLRLPSRLTSENASLRDGVCFGWSLGNSSEYGAAVSGQTASTVLVLSVVVAPMVPNSTGRQQFGLDMDQTASGQKRLIRLWIP
ncbi:uncharacterized protein G2W53_022446 [Senna tora]|uniref:Uncharacterized protein n=1 Tax=Senna tora TaxID=362788 RepID=A0A834WIR5_9FABA|nr:uncharacterized protein G2W53_022446 [Senna tora]